MTSIILSKAQEGLVTVRAAISSSLFLTQNILTSIYIKMVGVPSLGSYWDSAVWEESVWL